MFTPEFTIHEKNEYVLVASHSLENPEAIRLSLQYNKARIAFAHQHLPAHMNACRIIYDVRGQSVSAKTLDAITESLAAICTVEFKR
ncbi:hypothetical protein ACO0LF_30640 [Undibacterium sp. Di27W]|uniref:hypothetical protein n=1 Tax=Undibacterium sp. Di27W TaxID=3413036 RepID=UPI003BF15B34